MHGKEVALIFLEEDHVILHDGQDNMPQVEGLAHELEHLRL